MGLQERVTGKKILFITTKELNYIRNVQEMGILKKSTENVTIIGSNHKKYSKRMLTVIGKTLWTDVRMFDAIFIGFAPQLILPLFYWKFKKKEIGIDFFISLFDTFVNDRKKIKEKGFIAYFIHKIDRITLKLADYIVVDTKADMEYFTKEFHCNKEKFFVLYLEANKTIFCPRPQNKPKGLKDKFVVLYFGSILPLQGVDIVLEAIKILKDEKKLFFQIIGPIPKQYEKPIQDNVEYINWLEQEELAEYIANADLCLAGHFSGDIDKARRTIPGKAFIYETMGKKMILGDCEANRELFYESEKNIFVKRGNSLELGKRIRSIYKER